MLDLVVTHLVRLVSALIGGPAELKAAEDASRAAEAKAAEEARRSAEAKAAEGARRATEAKAAAEDARRTAEAKAVEDASRVAKSKAADGAQSAAATHPGKRPEKMAAPPADLKGIIAKPRTRPASQKRTPPTMRAR
jgi:membrane protein involved in colicin uptake